MWEKEAAGYPRRDNGWKSCGSISSARGLRYCLIHSILCWVYDWLNCLQYCLSFFFVRHRSCQCRWCKLRDNQQDCQRQQELHDVRNLKPRYNSVTWSCSFSGFWQFLSRLQQSFYTSSRVQLCEGWMQWGVSEPFCVYSVYPSILNNSTIGTSPSFTPFVWLNLCTCDWQYLKVWNCDWQRLFTHSGSAWEWVSVSMQL